MKNKVTNLSEHKKIKRNRKIISDIKNINRVLVLAQEALKHFKSYVAVQELISIMETNKNILQMQSNKYQKELSELLSVE